MDLDESPEPETKLPAPKSPVPGGTPSAGNDTYPTDFVDPRLSDPWPMGIVGNIGSGKTVLVERLIQMWKFIFDVIVIISPTYGLQPHHELRDARGIVVFETFSVENLNVIKQHQQARNISVGTGPPRVSRMLLILDDNGTATRKLLQGGALDDLIIKCRHFKINIVQLAQRYTQLSPTLRANCKYLILFSECNPQERRNLYMYHGFGDRKWFFKIFDQHTNKQYSWIGLQCFPRHYQWFTAADGYL